MRGHRARGNARHDGDKSEPQTERQPSAPAHPLWGGARHYAVTAVAAAAATQAARREAGTRGRCLTKPSAMVNTLASALYCDSLRCGGVAAACPGLRSPTTARTAPASLSVMVVYLRHRRQSHSASARVWLPRYAARPTAALRGGGGCSSPDNRGGRLEEQPRANRCALSMLCAEAGCAALHGMATHRP